MAGDSRVAGQFPQTFRPMTLTDVRNDILLQLASRDTVRLDDLTQVRVPEEVKDKRDAILVSVLKDLEVAGILRGYENETDYTQSVWVLTAPLGAAGQQVGLSLVTCAGIADEVNAFIDAMDLEIPPTDALAVGESDVVMLLTIISALRGEGPADSNEP